MDVHQKWQDCCLCFHSGAFSNRAGRTSRVQFQWCPWELNCLVLDVTISTGSKLKGSFRDAYKHVDKSLFWEHSLHVKSTSKSFLDASTSNPCLKIKCSIKCFWWKGQKTSWRCLIKLTLWSNVCFAFLLKNDYFSFTSWPLGTYIAFEDSSLLKKHAKSTVTIRRIHRLFSYVCDIETPFDLLIKVKQMLNKLFLFAARRRPNRPLDDGHRKSANPLIDFEVPICTGFVRWG